MASLVGIISAKEKKVISYDPQTGEIVVAEVHRKQEDPGIYLEELIRYPETSSLQEAKDLHDTGGAADWKELHQGVTHQQLREMIYGP